MNMTARRLRSIGWIATLVVCAALVMVLAFRVNALRSQVHQSDARIVALRQETMYLETEFETRANQQQLKAWNDVDFGYAAPTAGQYLDNERQLASFAKPIEPDAPAPVRVASADDSVDAAAAFPAMVSPMTGKPTQAARDAAVARPDSDDDAVPPPAAHHKPAAPAQGLAGLADRLATVPHGARPAAARKAAAERDIGEPADAKPVAARPAKAVAHDHPARKAHLASAADAHRPDRAAGRPLITLALKDAKSVK